MGQSPSRGSEKKIRAEKKKKEKKERKKERKDVSVPPEALRVRH